MLTPVRSLKRLTLLLPTQDAGHPGLSDLCLPEDLWEQGYAKVMEYCPVDRPLHSFWKHYYGPGAELALRGEDLLSLYADSLQMVLLCERNSSLAHFLDSLARHCLLAHRLRGSLHVVVD